MGSFHEFFRQFPNEGFPIIRLEGHRTTIPWVLIRYLELGREISSDGRLGFYLIHVSPLVSFIFLSFFIINFSVWVSPIPTPRAKILHDSYLKGFPETAIISSSSPPFTSWYSRLYVPDKRSVCNSLSWYLLFSSASIKQRLACSSSLFFEPSSYSSDSPDKLSSSPSLSGFGHSPDSWSSLRCSTPSLNDTLFLRSVVRLSMYSGILSTSDRTTSLFSGSLVFIEFPPCVSYLFIMVTSGP